MRGTTYTIELRKSGHKPITCSGISDLINLKLNCLRCSFAGWDDIWISKYVNGKRVTSYRYNRHSNLAIELKNMQRVDEVMQSFGPNVFFEW